MNIRLILHIVFYFYGCTIAFSQNRDSIQVLSSVPVADFDFFCPGLETIWEWKEKNENKPFTAQPIFYFAFEKQDEITIDLDLSKGVFGCSYFITRYPENTSVIGALSVGDLKGFRLTIKEKGIYKFTVISDNVYDGIASLKITRKPARKETQNFVTSVVKTKVYKATTVFPATILALEGGAKSKVLIPVKLPANTEEWYLKCINVENQGVAPNLSDQLNKLTRDLRVWSPDSVSGISLNMLNPGPGPDSCKIVVLDKKNSKLFKKQKDENLPAFQSVSIESRKGIVKISETRDSLYWIGIPDFGKDVNRRVELEVVALVSADNYIPGPSSAPKEKAVIKLRRAEFKRNLVIGGNTKNNVKLLPIEYQNGTIYY